MTTSNLITLKVGDCSVSVRPIDFVRYVQRMSILGSKAHSPEAAVRRFNQYQRRAGHIARAALV